MMLIIINANIKKNTHTFSLLIRLNCIIIIIIIVIIIIIIIINFL